MRRAFHAIGVEIGIELAADAFAGANSREERP
jgi:hypothetical protein